MWGILSCVELVLRWIGCFSVDDIFRDLQCFFGDFKGSWTVYGTTFWRKWLSLDMFSLLSLESWRKEKFCLSCFEDFRLSFWLDFLTEGNWSDFILFKY